MEVTISTQPVKDYRQRNLGRPNNPTVKRIDWSNSSDRKWLTNHLHWAMNNDHEVVIFPTPVRAETAQAIVDRMTNGLARG
jgi:hypothetical protein